MGEVTAWIEAIGTAVGAGAVIFAASEWRSGRRERRDNQANQARLVHIELKDPPPIGWGSSPEDKQSNFLVVVHNHSKEAVFEVKLHAFEQRVNGQPAIAKPDFTGIRKGAIFKLDDAPIKRALAADSETNFGGIEWFASGPSASDPGREVFATIQFDDAQGRTWRKTMRAAPARVLP